MSNPDRDRSLDVLNRLSFHVDRELDPVVKAIGFLVAGFHKADIESDLGDPFRMGAEQRARLDRIEDRVLELSHTVEQLESIRPLPADPEPPGSGRRDPVGEDEYQTAFWASYLGVGFVTQLLATLVIEGYLQTTHHHVHRAILLGVAAAVLTVTVLGLPAVTRLACSRWRSQLSTVWCLTSIGSIGIFAYLDGGIHSPLLYLLALPVLYATAALELPEVRSCVLAAVFQPVWLTVINPKVTGPYAALLVLFGFVIGVSVLAVTLAGYRSRLQDQQRILTRELQARSVTDGLTGCLTSRAFHQSLSEEFIRATRDRRPLSLLLCDVDLLKEYNEIYGHLAGDDILIRLSSVIRGALRSSDYLGRVGGDEFGVILTDTTERNAYVVAGRIMARVTRNGSASASLSIGVAALDATMTTSADLYHLADRALYEAKRTGRGTLRASSSIVES